MGLMWGRCGGEGVRLFCPPFLCSICHQSGHKAEMCPNGQVDWVAKLGNRAFRLRPPQYWTDDKSNPKNRRCMVLNLRNFELSSIEYAVYHCKEKCKDYEDIANIARETFVMYKKDIFAKNNIIKKYYQVSE